MPSPKKSKRPAPPSYDLREPTDIDRFLIHLPTYSFCARQLVTHCRGKRDRECLARLLKFAAICEQNFEYATALRQIEEANRPMQSARKEVRRG